MRAKLEPRIVAAKEARLAHERAELIQKRKLVVQAAYAKFQKTLVPLQWIYLPPVDEIYEIPEFDSLFNHPSDDKLKEELLVAAKQCIPGFIAARAERFKQAMLAMLAPAQKNHPAGVSSLPAASSSTALAIDRLSLATSVFRCTASGSCSKELISYHEVMSHHCSSVEKWPRYRLVTASEPDPEKRFSFSERGSAVVASLMTLLERDMTKTTPEDLDHIDARFECLSCSIGPKSDGVVSRVAWSWRGCVSDGVPFAVPL